MITFFDSQRIIEGQYFLIRGAGVTQEKRESEHLRY